MPNDDGHSEAYSLPPQQLLKAKKGRGAVSNLQGRYEVQVREDFDDGWPDSDDETSDTDAPAAPAWKTEVFTEEARTILSRNASPDLPFGVSLNPYRGCEHEMQSRSGQLLQKALHSHH